MRRRHNPRIDQLRALSAFAGCDDAELEIIDGCGATLPVPAGHVVARKDTVARECFVIRSGLVQVFDGDRHVTTRGPGEWIGEMALLDGSVRCASARTVSQSELMV